MAMPCSARGAPAWAIVLLGLAFLGCALTSARRGGPTTGAWQPPAPPKPTEETRGAREARELVASVRRLQDASVVELPRDVISALRALVASLDVYPSTWSSRIAIRDAVDALARPEHADQEEPRLLQAALEHTGGALLMLRPSPTRLPQQRAATAAVSRAASTVGQAISTEERWDAARQALREATNVVFLARGSPPPFGATSAAPPRPWGANPGTTAEAVTRARQALASLRQAKSSRARAPAADVFLALAAGLSALSSSENPASPRTLAVILLQVDRLQEADPLALQEAAWVKTGLAAVMDGLSAALRMPRDSELAPPMTSTGAWFREARLAIETVDDQMRFTFQRAVIQDAFRTVVDAFAVAVQSPECPR
jgi:hypothetical protein